MNNVIELIREDLKTYKPYSSARDEAKNGQIWLNANESPYCFDLFYDVKINRYPEKQPAEICNRIAELYRINRDQIVLTRGSDEAIDLLIRLFCKAGHDAIAICPPTYGMYAVSARLQGAKLIEIPLLKESGFQLDLPAILRQSANFKIIFLCSPNNPTGNLLKKEEVLNLCSELINKSIVVVDEAYLEFSTEESLSQWIAQYPNLVILRTLSKAYGLAGARFGFLFAQEELVQWILKIIAPYPLPSPIAQIVLDALSAANLDKIKKNIREICDEKSRLIIALQGFHFIKRVFPSDANFILVELENAEKIMQLCTNEGIVLREMFDKAGLDNCVRISIGSPAENMALIALLTRVT